MKDYKIVLTFRILAFLPIFCAKNYNCKHIKSLPYTLKKKCFNFFATIFPLKKQFPSHLLSWLCIREMSSVPKNLRFFQHQKKFTLVFKQLPTLKQKYYFILSLS